MGQAMTDDTPDFTQLDDPALTSRRDHDAPSHACDASTDETGARARAAWTRAGRGQMNATADTAAIHADKNDMARPADTQDETLNMLQIAENLESENHLWIVIFGIYSRQFVAFPRFNAPAGTIAVAMHPGALTDVMRRIERAMQIPRTLPSFREIYVW
jgi:hypothetical protein